MDILKTKPARSGALHLGWGKSWRAMDLKGGLAMILTASSTVSPTVPETAGCKMQDAGWPPSRPATAAQGMGRSMGRSVSGSREPLFPVVTSWPSPVRGPVGCPCEVGR